MQEQLAGPPSVQDQWELVAWKTGSHSLKRLPGQQQQLLSHGVSDLASSLDSGQLSSPLSRELSSRDLMLQGTGASTTQAVANANKIHLGMCIGAGMHREADGAANCKALCGGKQSVWGALSSNRVCFSCM